MESGLYITEQQQQQQQQEEDQNQQNQAIARTNSCCTANPRQRLIPLTSEIILAMMDFNGSHSSTNISEKPFYNTFSITSLVREEVHNILREFTISDQFIRKEEIDELIERCLKEKVMMEEDTKQNSPAASETHDELEVTVEMLTESDKNKLIVENFQILEQRITNLEERISTMLQTIPKLRHLQAKKFKINTQAIREELKLFMDKMEKQSSQDNNVAMKAIKEKERSVANPYDDFYYELRQRDMNLLNYKKSIVTMELNERALLNPFVRPVKIEIPENNSKEIVRPMFICNE